MFLENIAAAEKFHNVCVTEQHTFIRTTDIQEIELFFLHNLFLYLISHLLVLEIFMNSVNLFACLVQGIILNEEIKLDTIFVHSFMMDIAMVRYLICIRNRTTCCPI